MGRLMPVSRSAVAKASSGSSSAPKWQQDELRARDEAYNRRPEVIALKNRVRAQQGLPPVPPPLPALASRSASSNGAGQKKKKELLQTRSAKANRANATGLSVKLTPYLSQIGKAAKKTIKDGDGGHFLTNQKLLFEFLDSEDEESSFFDLDTDQVGPRANEQLYWDMKCDNPRACIFMGRGSFATLYGKDLSFCEGIAGLTIVGKKHTACLRVHSSRLHELAAAMMAKESEIDIVLIYRSIDYTPGPYHEYQGWEALDIEPSEISFDERWLSEGRYCEGEKARMMELFHLESKDLEDYPDELSEEQRKERQESVFWAMPMFL